MIEPDATSQGNLPVMVLLGDRSAATRAVYHALEDAFANVRLFALLEKSPARVKLARRRARKLGWWTVGGQILFVAAFLPVLRYRARRRVQTIATLHGLDFGPIPDAKPVDSVNDDAVIEAIRRASPSLVVVHGTRVISDQVLHAIAVPIVNLHAGITPRYRGVHGGYWAFFDNQHHLAGTTVHLVDSGIDTGGILGQATFERLAMDSIATYPYLHLACGLPLLVKTADTALAGKPLLVVPPIPGAESSRLRWHPTAWSYVAARIGRGVR